MASYALASRTQMVEETGERVRAINFCYPIYSDSQYAPWQIRAAFGLLGVLNRGGTSLGYRMVPAAEALAMPLVRWIRTPDKLRSVALHHQYQFDWPERVVLDTAFDAARMGPRCATTPPSAGWSGCRPAAGASAWPTPQIAATASVRPRSRRPWSSTPPASGSTG